MNEDSLLCILSFLPAKELIRLSLNKRYITLLPNLLRSTIITRLDLSEFNLNQLMNLAKDYQIETGSYFAAIKINHQVYAFGRSDPDNDLNQQVTSTKPTLFHNDIKSISCLTRGIAFINLDNRLISEFGKFDNIVKVSAGESYLSFLTDNNKLYIIGELDELEFNEPTLLNTHIQDRIIDMAAGDCYLLVLTEKGLVYSFGYNVCGALGLGDLINRTELTLIPGLKDIVQISSKVASFCLNKYGRVYSFGVGGGLGLDDEIDRLSPMLIPNLTDIAEIKAGYWFGLAVNKYGDVWSFGCNRHCQLGYSNSVQDQLTPKKIEIDNIISMGAGLGCSYLINRDEQIFSFGINGAGQLGLGHKDKVEDINLVTF